MIRVAALTKSLPLLLVALLVGSCGRDKSYVLLWHELNTSGVKHTVSYNSEVLPTAIIFETFHGSGSKDTTGVDSVLRREVDSIKFDLDNNTILLTRLDDASHKDFRKYYFNSDNLLTRITRFDKKTEYVTDSVTYDYTKRTAKFYDVINKMVYELVYDQKNNIESEIQKRVSDQRVFYTNYYYYDASKNPFIVNLEDDETLFGCFNMMTIGLFWNNASRPMFSSVNNVQSFKEVAGSEERNGLFEYHYAQGLPLAQFGTNGVIYRRYLQVPE